jgi:gas vesicle protein
MSENNRGSMVGGFLLGAAIGAGLALIFAPMAGSETRRRIGATARKLKSGTQGQVDHMMDTLKQGAEDVGSAINAGKEAYRRSPSGAPLEKTPV